MKIRIPSTQRGTYVRGTNYPMRARLIDVAARAGVAPNTASTILNNRPDSWASKETRERVLLAAKELNYRPSKAALGVRLGRYNTIGLVVPDLHNPFYPVLADYLARTPSALEGLLDPVASPDYGALTAAHGRLVDALARDISDALLAAQAHQR